MPGRWIGKGGGFGAGRIAPLRLVGIAAISAAAFTWFRSAGINQDSAWLLVATEKWLNGAVLYRDIVEVNPPLIFFLTAPILRLEQVFGLTPTANFHLVLVGSRLLRRS